MSLIETMKGLYEFNRGRTLGLLEKIEQESDPQQVLAWRPGPGRAHIAWQLMHIGITEQLFASERLATKDGRHRDLWDRFKGGSTPDDDIPSPSQIREVLAAGREDLLVTLGQYGEAQLEDIVWEARDGRRLKLLDVLRIISWHEAHHQGQAHITFNLWNAGK
jgi:uncharacterized damage-inducible protein DinB